MEYTHTCEQCQTQFKSLRPQSQFCSPACRKKASRGKIVAKTEDIISSSQGKHIFEPEKISEAEDKGRTKFVPNWKLHGFKDKEEGMLFAIAMIKVKQKELKQAGLSDDLSITWHSRSVML